MAHGESPRHKPRKRARKGAKAPEQSRARSKAAARVDESGKPLSTSPKRPSAGAGAKKGTAPAGSIGVGPIRLQKLLASAGFGSRRDVERFLSEERVTVNGRVAKLGDRADPSADEIRFDGERLLPARPAYWIVNKPRGVVTTVRDDEGRRTIVDLLPKNVGRLFPVGRLDRETTGLVLMTNDGDAAHVLLHPSLGNEREYRVSVKGRLDARGITRLERGVSLEEGRTSPARVVDVRFDADSGTSSLTLTLCEGKKRQIRRSLLVLGFPVRRLVRVRMGPLKIGRLAVGEARPLRSEERRALLEHVRRLRAGEAPVTSSARSKDARRVGATRKAPASPPRSKPTRRARGASTTASRGGRSSTAGSGQRKKAAARKSPASRKGDTSRKSAARRKPSAGRASRDREPDPSSRPVGKTTHRTGGKSGSKSLRASKPSGPSKSAARKPQASRKPGPRGGQRTASSRKGVKR